jgi:hypothetical protein
MGCNFELPALSFPRRRPDRTSIVGPLRPPAFIHDASWWYDNAAAVQERWQEFTLSP